MSIIDDMENDDTQPSLEEEAQIAIDSIKKSDSAAEATDLHGRPTFGHDALGLDVDKLDDVPVIEASFRGELVAYVSLRRREGKTHAKVVPADGYLADARDLMGHLPGWWDAEIAKPETPAEKLRRAYESDDPGPLIRSAREQMGWSRYEMGRHLGIAVQDDARDSRTLEQWETGKRTPGWESRKKLKALADKLDD